MIALGINLVMTVIGFAVSTVFIVFVCTRLICVRIHLSSSRRSFPTASRYDLSLVERGLHGVEPVVVATFPTKKFGDEFFSFGEDAQCTVCLVEYQEKDILRILPYCGHSFHITCIDKWLQQHSTCPVCRISLHDSPKRKRMIQPMFSSFVQSPYGVDSLDSNSSHCLYSSHGFSSSAVDNRRMEPIQEDQYTSEVDATEARESIASLTEDNRAPKDTCLHKLENKQVESLSNL